MGPDPADGGDGGPDRESHRGMMSEERGRLRLAPLWAAEQ